jgi:hypothetical protein
LAVDTEFGRGHRLYALSQGIWDLPVIDENEGLPASANTGTLMRVERDGSVSDVAGPLDQPTSLEFVADTAYVVTLTGKVMRIDGVPTEKRWTVRCAGVIALRTRLPCCSVYQRGRESRRFASKVLVQDLKSGDWGIGGQGLRSEDADQLVEAPSPARTEPQPPPANLNAGGS